MHPVGIIAAVVLCIIVFAEADCAADVCYAFKTYGFDSKRSFGKDSISLKLVSSGMRTKNLFVTTVDVYAIGLYVSDSKEKELQSIEANPAIITSTLAAPTVDTPTSVGIVLKFARDVGMEKIVDALYEALAGKGDDSYEKSLSDFKELLTLSIGKAGMKKGEEIEFNFNGSSGYKFGLNIRGNDVELQGQLLRTNLIEVYTGPSAVAPDVVKNIATYLTKS